MEERVFSHKRIIRGVIIGAIISLIVFFIWANFFYFKKCESADCFNDYLVKCQRARYVGTGNMTFEFKIFGKESELCKINVKLLRGDLSNQDSLTLKEKSMRCNLPYGVVSGPVDDLSLCNGPLKEGLQDLIIKKMHTYIVQNLERINFGMFD